MQPFGAELFHAPNGMAGSQQLEHFVEQAGRRDVLDELGHFTNRPAGGRVDRQAKFCRQAHGAQHAHGVFAVADFWIANHAQRLLLQIGHAVVIVDDGFGGRVEVQGIDREVAPCCIFLLATENVVAQHAALVVGLSLVADMLIVVAAKGGDFDGLRPHHHVHDLEAASDDASTTEAAAHLFRCGVGGYVIVLGDKAGDQVAHCPTHDIGFVAVLLKCLHGAPTAAADGVAADTVFADADNCGLAGCARRFASEDTGYEFADHRSFLVMFRVMNYAQ